MVWGDVEEQAAEIQIGVIWMQRTGKIRHKRYWRLQYIAFNLSQIVCILISKLYTVDEKVLYNLTWSGHCQTQYASTASCSDSKWCQKCKEGPQCSAASLQGLKWWQASLCRIFYSCVWCLSLIVISRQLDAIGCRSIFEEGRCPLHSLRCQLQDEWNGLVPT